jgi:hypothetical protein
MTRSMKDRRAPATAGAMEAATETADAGRSAGEGTHLQNRVDPFGSLFSGAARGLFMGNRGGRIHDPETRTLDARRRWTSKAWICCETSFRERSRAVWSEGYTELFFLDEVTALAAGHRPCFECRRKAATDFAAAFAAGNGMPSAPPAARIDKILHAERLDPDSAAGRDKKLYVAFIDTLPDGAVIAYDGAVRQAYGIRGGYVLPWSAEGWGGPLPRPRRQLVTLVTPPSTVMTLKAGYSPVWHPSACTQAFDRGYGGSSAAA